jgi:two-component system response regulator AtoC
MKKESQKLSILIVDDEEDILNVLKLILTKEGYQVDTALDGKQALQLFRKNSYDIVLTDLKMPEIDGMELLERIKEIRPETEVLIMTAYASVESAVLAMKKGAADYIVKPFLNEDVKMRVARVAEHIKLKKDVEVLKQQISQKFETIQFLGTSPQIQQILSLIEQVAPTKSNVLILGESGTGKSLVAELIHKNSPRRDGPFISINCAAIPETLLEAELFGYKKGAFTGAVADKKGLIELANGGTLFLDEIGDLPLGLQAKLLKFLETYEFIPLGDVQKKKVDIRLISATNKNLEELIEEGKFREDLYYRLSVIEIKIPPLRERKEDIPVLVYYFLEQASKQHNKKIKGITNEALSYLLNYDWSGNIRELRNVIERAVILARDEYILPHDLPEKIIKSSPSPEIGVGKSLKEAIEEYEKTIILNTLKFCNYDKERAAKILDIDLATLYRKLKKFGINH